MQQDKYVFDLGRILLGNLPAVYLVEIIIRTAIVYAYALFIVRLLGKRGMGQLAPFDFIIIIALGSAVGDPMFYPNVPLLHALAAITCIVIFTRVLVFYTMKSRALQAFVSAQPRRLIVDGVIQLEALKRERLSRSEIFEALRTSGVEQLGEVERCYLEPSGKISVFRHDKAECRAGIPTTPDSSPHRQGTYSLGEAAPDGLFGCTQCGTVLTFSRDQLYPPCPNCGGERWVKVVSCKQD